jgi:hypothetical protein
MAEDVGTASIVAGVTVSGSKTDLLLFQEIDNACERG